MSKKEKKNDMRARASAGEVTGSVLRSFFDFLVFLFKIIFKFLKIFGLWIPLLYALFGLILYWAFRFDPFKFDALGTLYLCGAIACVIAAAIISVKNVVVKPAKSIIKGFRDPVWKRKTQEEYENADKAEVIKSDKKESKLNPPKIEEYVESDEKIMERLFLPVDDFQPEGKEIGDKKYSSYPDWLPEIDEHGENHVVSVYKNEVPQIYFSKLEPDIMVHEYSDRFELFRLEGTKTIPVRVEHK